MPGRPRTEHDDLLLRQRAAGDVRCAAKRTQGDRGGALDVVVEGAAAGRGSASRMGWACTVAKSSHCSSTFGQMSLHGGDESSMNA